MIRFSCSHVAGRTGISPLHQFRLQQLAAHLDLAFAFRPVEPVATGLIAAGHPTKNFHIKGKSASWGPQAGLICCDQRFSKLVDQDDARIRHFNAQVAGCIAAGHAVAVPLLVTRERLVALQQLGKLDALRPGVDGTLTVAATAPGGSVHRFLAQPQPDGRYRISHEGAAIQVLAPCPGARPLTADYDMLVLAVPLADFGPQDNLPISLVSHTRFHPGNNPVLRARYPDPAAFYAREDPDLGNASLRIRRLIPVFNRSLGCAPGAELVHHNADCGSPATDLSANFPASFFLPRPLGRYPTVGVIEHKTAFADWVLTLKDAGFHVPLNPLWAGLTGIRRSGFVAARARVAG